MLFLYYIKYYHDNYLISENQEENQVKETSEIHKEDDVNFYISDKYDNYLNKFGKELDNVSDNYSDQELVKKKSLANFGLNI